MKIQSNQHVILLGLIYNTMKNIIESAMEA